MQTLINLDIRKVLIVLLLCACVPAMLACWLLNCTHFDRQKHALNGLTLHKKVKDGNVYRNYSEFLISP